ncbi:Choline-sulfatase [Pontiella desulfatans]|uniref:Choline-sulfatase n=1 Tax=Pontiella desulfatans TaxID=2750659 RepID=A0A6C2U2C4_PONDE|nr:arylsulfatase [Pontiella desulfatans]SPS73884.1 sulfatase S1_15 [Kiritimatiellales bacterium]VGO13939.1 Choline-sulfatase [Pontiella desulfatans]
MKQQIIIAIILGFMSSPAARAEAKPNVLIFLADDLGYGDVGFNGADKFFTPHLDRLAQEGTVFKQAYTPNAVCTPTRYAVLTGRYCWRTSLKRHVAAGDDPLLISTNRMTLPKLFQQNGYVTAGFGKWHIGLGVGEKTDWTQPLKPGPCEVGFDLFQGFPANLGNQPQAFMENHEIVNRIPGEDIEEFPNYRFTGIDSSRTDDAASRYVEDKAVAFIAENAKKPFFMVVNPAEVHWPIVPRNGNQKSAIGPYGDFVQQMDGMMGSILTELEEQGILDNTLIVFTSDNGGVEGENHRMVNGQPTAYHLAVNAGHDTTGGWRGRKHSIFEGGFRVPFAVRWPGKVPAGAVNDSDLVGVVDLMATLAAAAGLDVPKEAAEDSINLWPLFSGKGKGARESVVMESHYGIFAIRRGDWKLIEYTGIDEDPPFNGMHKGENKNRLFNLSETPGEAEVSNVWKDHPEKVEQLLKELETIRGKDWTRPTGLQN